jgi:hypothetical protein
MSSSFRPEIHFHDLRRGAAWDVPGGAFDVSLREAVDLAALASSDTKLSARAGETSFRVQADFREVRDGNGYFAIDSAVAVAGGKIGPGARLCTGIACSTLATAPIAWRWLLNRYLRYVARSAESSRVESFGSFPQALPWVHLYTSHAWDELKLEERTQAENMLRTLGLLVLGRAQQAVHEAVREGKNFRPDPKEFPELRPDL